MTTPILVFLILTVAMSVVAGLAAFAIGGADTFETPRALPLLLVTIWSPNIAAVIVTLGAGESVSALLDPLARNAPLAVWVAALSPLVVAAVVGWRRGMGLPSLSPTLAVPLVGMNLMMGPLGEEIGWRGFMLPRVADAGLVVAAAAVGVVWALWHLPLWWLPSPHREIPYPLFFVTVVCFSMTMTALWAAGDGALGPIVVFHLCANVGVGWLEVSERSDAPTAYRRGLPLHGAIAVAATTWLALGATAPA
jgi:CAAX protease family protein